MLRMCKPTARFAIIVNCAPGRLQRQVTTDTLIAQIH